MMILLAGWLSLMVISGAAAATAPQQPLWSPDVEVFGSVNDGLRSQSISYAAADEPSSSGVSVERFPRQLDTVHDHLRAGRSHHQKQQQQQPAKKRFDSDYDRFISEHFRQDYQRYNPGTESEQMARDHDRFQELPHLTSRPSAKYTNAPKKPVSHSSGGGGHGSRSAKLKQKSPRRPTIQEDVEDYQPNDDSSSSSFDQYSPSDEYQRIKALSEQQAKEIRQNPKHCKKILKDDMECHVCHNPKTGDKSESCSYASTPNTKKYAYIKENNYSSKDDDKEDADDDEEEEEAEEEEVQTKRPPLKKQKQQSAKPSRRPRIKRGGARRLHSAESKKIETYEDFFASLFPEYQKYQEEKNVNDDDGGKEYEFIPSSGGGGGHKQDVEKALAEFRQKDWSDCKKVSKGELTCYECEDEHGVHHEECMFISESSPKSSRLTYTEGENYDSAKLKGKRNKGGQDGEAEEESDEANDDDDEEEEEEEAASESVSIKENPLNGKEGKNNNVADRGDDGVVLLSGKKKSAGNKKSNVKLNRKVVIKKRKLKQDNGEQKDASLAKTDELDDLDEGHAKPVKRTIRKKVTYRKSAKNVKHSGGTDSEPEESRIMYFEQKLTHES